MNWKKINFDVKGDERGSLIALEACDNIPFEIKRVYYIYGTHSNVIRGKHAHKKLKQVIICMSGSCDFILDDGVNRETVHMNKPDQGIYIYDLIWREFTNFSNNCIVMVLASEHYNNADYIRDYNEFLKEVKK